MEETQPKTFVFVLMPFDPRFADVYVLGIRQACKDAGAYCERVDEQIFDENILERIYTQIAKADVIVADMTGQNPNVFYETGYAHALNKRVILITQDRKDIPFDLSHYTHLVYEGEGKITFLKTELERRIRWCIENPKESLARVEINPQFSINGVPVAGKPAVTVNRIRYSYFSIDIHNPTGKMLDSESFRIALILPRRAEFKEPGVLSAAMLAEGRYLYTVEHDHKIFPFGWDSIKVVIEFFDAVNGAEEATLRLFTEVGYKDFSFVIKPD
ncbi:MAG TPA: hypothetical protein VGB98_13125 [Pyrinomonadaceae bacterium]|jgi:hypothetical protein